ncbi:hypothetical protein [Fimbriiglobus ruber]|uniref:hypothetical protein n=1 Tax=Fimbriiglobus ruber TaxID=1908690 RepID=UPI001179C43B|nr:hypothetical protein [Fimbriiglobus ruber]
MASVSRRLVDVIDSNYAGYFPATPKGVEHNDDNRSPQDYDPGGMNAVTPNGVEHRPRRPVMERAASDERSDAERR